MAKHDNSGKCPKCQEILSKFGGTHATLLDWFKRIQLQNPEIHCSCAGRNKADQELALKNRASKASFGQSPHNFSPSLAIDVFRISNGNASWVQSWYDSEIRARLDDDLSWGGTWKSFKDYPHVELENWRALVKAGSVKLIP